MSDILSASPHPAQAGHACSAQEIAFPATFLARLSRSDPRSLRLGTMTGDSMEPTLRPGDLAVVDPGCRNPGHDGPFALHVDGALSILSIARVARGPRPGRILVLPDNRARHPSADRALTDVEAVGRVILTLTAT